MTTTADRTPGKQVDASETAASEHVLLTVLGTNPQVARYRLGECEAEARLAPLALLDLLPEASRPSRVLALCTSAAKAESWPVLEEALRDRCPAAPIDVPAGEAQEDVDAYLRTVTQAIPARQDVDLTVDVTHGYRHFSFLTYVAVLYLAALRRVRVRGAYYGLLRRDGPSPFLDLRPLLGLPQWLYAIEALRDTGSAQPIALAVGDGPQSQDACTISRELSQIAEAYLSGLPIELGQFGRRFRKQRLKPLRKLLENDHRLPLAQELTEQLGDTLKPFALSQPACGDGWKKKVTLSPAELKRQADLIDDHLNRGSTATALGLMNEWTVSWATWRLGHEQGWLDFQVIRRRTAGLLGAIAALSRDSELSSQLEPEQRALGDFWTLLCELRNAYHHHGMRPQVLVGKAQIAEKLEKVKLYWSRTLRSCPGPDDFAIALGDSHHNSLLVTPLGRRPGVLLSAVQACRDAGAPPSCCLVICSVETQALVAEAAERAGYTGAIERLCLKDPYGGRSEIKRLARDSRKVLLATDSVFVNVTGGTTLMGLTAEALAGAARDLARPVRRFGLIDRRPSDQQDADPYQVGEPFWLDAAEDADGSDD